MTDAILVHLLTAKERLRLLGELSATRDDDIRIVHGEGATITDIAAWARITRQTVYTIIGREPRLGPGMHIAPAGTNPDDPSAWTRIGTAR